MLVPSKETYIEDKYQEVNIDKSQTLNNTYPNDDIHDDINMSPLEDAVSDKKVYYEIGCKIFEINKIYK